MSAASSFSSAATLVEKEEAMVARLTEVKGLVYLWGGGAVWCVVGLGGVGW
jgi:hypothetical protein